MVKKGLNAFNGNQVLLLQGPVGPFFKKFGQDLEENGATVYKVNFNGGDWFFSNSANSINFTDSIKEWPDFFRSLLEKYWIDTIILFGDCRQHHSIARSIATEKEIDIGVFEEGYVRPDYITFEKYGVNGSSRIPKDPSFYKALDESKFTIPEAQSVGYSFWHSVLWAILYYFFSALMFLKFRRYRHHRPLNLFEGLYWIRSLCRKWWYKNKENTIENDLTTVYSKRYFLAPLQISTDAQVTEHSYFSSVEHFIEKIINSFSSHAPKDTILIIKHHPLDRGYHDYTALIKRLAKHYNILSRVFYIHDQHLPTLLEYARGVIVINSTVGFSAIHHNTPLKVCGTAIYDLEGLTYQKSLEKFWNDAQNFQSDHDLYNRFKGYVINQKQLNGSFYKKLKASKLKSGILW